MAPLTVLGRETSTAYFFLLLSPLFGEVDKLICNSKMCTHEAPGQPRLPPVGHPQMSYRRLRAARPGATVTQPMSDLRGEWLWRVVSGTAAGVHSPGVQHSWEGQVGVGPRWSWTGWAGQFPMGPQGSVAEPLPGRRHDKASAPPVSFVVAGGGAERGWAINLSAVTGLGTSCGPWVGDSRFWTVPEAQHPLTVKEVLRRWS